MGNIYIAGVTSSPNFPKAAQTRFSSGGPTFLAKLNPTATTLLYTAFIPGTGGTPFQMPGGSNVPLSSVNIALAVDQTGNAYFASSGSPGQIGNRGSSGIQGAIQSGGPSNRCSGRSSLLSVSFTSTRGAILNENGSLNSASNPAHAGSVVAIFGTGGGPLDPAGVTGDISPLKPLGHLTLPVFVQLDGNDVEVVYSGTAPTLNSGFFQIHFRLPLVVSPSGSHFVGVKIGTQSSGQQRRVTIAIE